ncbi:hypothetical protein [Ferrovibrio sp.]|uniref:hypothetical protein n=1 Tax=Ferrovibrio sp. TaxID=1917215 RepID=UPI0035B1C085
MALLLDKPADFGAVANYHIIDRLDYDKSAGEGGSTAIHLAGWVNQQVREASFPVAQVRSIVRVAGPPVSLEAAYNYLKTLPEWSNAQDG